MQKYDITGVSRSSFSDRYDICKFQHMTKLRSTLLIGAVMFSALLHGQKMLNYTTEDSQRFAALTQQMEALGLSDLANNERLITLGKLFLGTPYVAKTLEQEGDESIVLNLRGLDCTTYVENVLAFNQLSLQSEKSLEEFGKQIERIRYRDGRLRGYSSRLHYFSDWISNNEEKGLVKDLTASLGGVKEVRNIDFMGKHPQFYPQLSEEAEVQKITKIEEGLSTRPFVYLPLAKIPAIEHQIESGDILALVTSINGLDVTHTGFALWQNGQLHLLHASTSGEVVISEKPLTAYLKGIKKNIGILVVRPL